MDQTLTNLLSELRRLKPVLERRYPIREMAVFGSWARGEQTADSDVDVLVDVGRGMTLLDLAGLQLELHEVLGLPVDVVTRNSLRPAMAQRVLTERIVL